MTNEELMAKYEAVKTPEDAYNLAKEGGYTGSMEAFDAMCKKMASEVKLDMDDMDQIAGGGAWDTISDGAKTTWNAVSNAFSTAKDWVVENKEVVIWSSASLVGMGALLYVFNKSHSTPDYDVEAQYGGAHYRGTVSSFSSNSSGGSAN